MTRSRLVWAAIILVALPIAQLFSLLLIRDQFARAAVSDAIQLLAALLAACIVTTLAIRGRAAESPGARAWSALAVGAWFWALGMVAFMVVEVGFERHAYPGFPDLFFFAFYPCAILGLLWLPRGEVSPAARLDSILDITALTVLSAMVLWDFNVYSLLQQMLETPSLGPRFSLAYTLLDALLLWMLFDTLVLRVSQTKRLLSVLALLAGFLCLVAADLIQGHISLGREFVSGGMVDLGWVLFSALAGLAATHELAALSASPAARWRPMSHAGRAILVTSITWICLGLLLLLLVWDAVRWPQAHPLFLPVAGLILYGLALYRQIRSIEENGRLCDQLRQTNERLDARVRERTAELESQADQLRESEERFRGVFETSPMGIAVIDVSTLRFLSANKGFLDMVQYDEQELLTKRVADILQADDCPEDGLSLNRAVTEGASGFSVQARCRRKSGDIRWATVTGGFFCSASGDTLAIANVVDITDRIRTEEALKLTQFSVEHASDAAYWMDSEARFEYVNMAACTSLGYTKEELLGMTVFDIDPVFTREDWARFWSDIVKQGSVTLQTVHKTKQGELIPVEISANFLDFGGKQYDFAFARDISDRVRAEQEKRRFYRETIRSVTQGKLELMSYPELSEYLNSAELKADFDCPSRVTQVRSALTQFCLAKGLGSERLELFETAIGEALTNALKHAHGGTACAGVHGDSVWACVSDTGPGISTLTLPGATLRKGFSTRASLGLGFSIMMEACDLIMLSTGADGTTVVLSADTNPREKGVALNEFRDTWDDVISSAAT